MTIKKLDEVFQRHKLKKTPLRLEILQAFLRSKRALTQAQLLVLLEKTGQSVDRVSVYRNLAQLQNLGVLHEVFANHYVFCNHDCHSHLHLLLYCKECARHQEVSEHVQLKGFLGALGKLEFFGGSQPVFLSGTCSQCAKN